MDRPTARRQTGMPAAYGKRPDGSAEAVPQVREGDPPHQGGRALPGGGCRAGTHAGAGRSTAHRTTWRRGQQPAPAENQTHWPPKVPEGHGTF